MREVVEAIRLEPSLEVRDVGSGWRIRIPREGGFVVEALVPHGVLEWFVDVKEPDGRQAWQDWAKYYVMPDLVETEARCEALMTRDIRLFVDRVLVSSLRIVEVRGFLGRRRKQVEWRRGDEDWTPMAMCLTGFHDDD